MGKETIACSNGIAKRAENIMKAIPTYIKHLGGRIIYRKYEVPCIPFAIAISSPT
jgi:hypothetical protein